MSTGAAVTLWRVWLYHKCLISFSEAVIKCSDKRNSRERGLCFSSQFKVVHCGVEVKMAEPEVAAHFKSNVRREG